MASVARHDQENDHVSRRNGSRSMNVNSTHANGVAEPRINDRRSSARATITTTSQGKPDDADGWFWGFMNRTLIPICLMAFTPNLVVVLWYTAKHCDGSFLNFYQRMTGSGLLEGIRQIWADVHLASALATYVLLGYIVFAIVLMVALPGQRVEGPVTPKGNIPVYKDNGFFCFLVTLLAFTTLTVVLKFNDLSPTIVYDHFDEFLVTLTVFSHVLCLILHVKGLLAPSTSDSGSSGNLVFDYYWGTELYPRIFGIDVKVFTNCRFGMTIWPLLCLIFALKSYELHGFVDSMWVSCGLQMLYFFKFFWWEAGYMRTIDIMLDRAGFYICWGCMAYIPGLYASVSLYLVNHPVQLGPVLSTIIFLAGIVALVLNYWADYQKQVVRETNGKCTIWGKKPELIRASYTLEGGEKRQSMLLLSGFWGLSRHFHYVAELALAFCWSVPGLFDNLMCYSYFIFLFILLVHRTFRDDKKCSQKYGRFWDDYCKRVSYKMIPGIF